MINNTKTIKLSTLEKKNLRYADSDDFEKILFEELQEEFSEIEWKNLSHLKWLQAVQNCIVSDNFLDVLDDNNEVILKNCVIYDVNLCQEREI